MRSGLLMEPWNLRLHRLTIAKNLGTILHIATVAASRTGMMLRVDIEALQTVGLDLLRRVPRL